MPETGRHPKRTRSHLTTVEPDRSRPVSQAVTGENVWSELEAVMAEGRELARARGQVSSRHDDLYDDEGLPR